MPRSAFAIPAALALALATAPAAGAHGAAEADALVSGGSGGLNAAAPTKKHAEEHAAIASFERKVAKMSPAELNALRQQALGLTGPKASGAKATRLADQEVGPADQFGAWTTPPFKAATYGIHGVLLPTGRVLIMSMGAKHGSGRPGHGNAGQGIVNDGAAAIWDPSRGTGPESFKFIPPPPTALDDPKKRKGYDLERPAPVFCSGHVQLADGRVLVAGGNLESLGKGLGLKLLFVFDPYTESWIRQPDLQHARWYPTETRLPSGKIVILSGTDELGTNRPEIEVYPAEGEPIPGIDTSAAPKEGTSVVAKRKMGLYPHAYVMKSGKLAVVGPKATDQGILDPANWSWRAGLGYRGGLGTYPTSFLEPGTTAGPERVFSMGGLAPGGSLQPLVLSTRPGVDSRWRDESSLNLSRTNAPAVLLPDGSAVIVGGGEKALRQVDPMSNWPTRRQVELWNPTTRKWTLGPAQRYPRGYHSIAMLLPDGRVLSGGDDSSSTVFDDNLNDRWDTTFEIYSPPYLFKGARPVIESQPKRVQYAQAFTFAVDGDASKITRVTMMAPSSVTHAIDMNQRHLDLEVVRRDGNTITVLAPPSGNAAPPGDYLLFALNGAGVPSVGKFVEVLPENAKGHPADDTAPTWVANPNPDEPDATTPTPTPTPTPAPSTRPSWWPSWLPWF